MRNCADTVSLPLEHCPPAKRSLTISRSFGRQVESLAELREAVAHFTTRAAEKLRRHHLVASALTVFVSTNRFAKDAPQYANAATVELACPTDATPELLARALAGVEHIYRPDFLYKKAGVMLSALAPASPLTVRLYDDDKWLRMRRLMNAVDALNARYGSDTIKFAVSGLKRRWLTNFEMRSHRYTTDWSELLTIA